MALKAERITDSILSLYTEHGKCEYIGEPVSVIQHSLQAAQLAKEQGYSDQIVVGAFLHDIGHLIGMTKGDNSNNEVMITDGVVLGTQNHDKIGEEYLRRQGLGGEAARLVGMHVQAKRYRVAVSPEYYLRLSEASKMTLEHQGGAMTAEEIRQFEVDPLKDIIIEMRSWDEAAKVPETFATEEQIKEGLQFIKELIIKELQYTCA